MQRVTFNGPLGPIELKRPRTIHEYLANVAREAWLEYAEPIREALFK